MSKIFIETSGYIYSHWENGVFYPKDLPKSKKLEYYSQHFKTVELNSTFYRLLKEEAFKSWHKRTPKDFIFAVKVPRFITHIKKLKDCQDFWQIFLKRVLILKEKLGPLLFQLPPNFKRNTKHFKDFIETIRGKTLLNLRFAFEFRNESWCKEEIYQILRERNCAWVIVDSLHWPQRDIVSANFVYVRMHGSKILFASEYTKKEVKTLARKIKKWHRQNLDVFVYFNNDAYGFAPKNAKELLEMLKCGKFC